MKAVWGFYIGKDTTIEVADDAEVLGVNAEKNKAWGVPVTFMSVKVTS